MRHAVRANRNDGGIERTQFVPPGEVERLMVRLGGNECRSGVAERCLDSPAAREVELFHPVDERLDLRRGAQLASELRSQGRRREVQAPARLVAPQPAAVLDEARTDKEGRWNAERSQDRISDAHIAAQAVVEDD